MASEEERTKTTGEAPEKIRMKFMMIVSLSIFKSQEQAPATITLMIILSQRFDSISNKYFDKKFCGLERYLVEDAERISHNVYKCGKQSKKHFSTRSGAAESSYRPLDPSVNSQPRTSRSFKLSQFRGERQALRGPTDICMRPARSLEEVLPSGILVLTMQESIIYKLSIVVLR